LPSEDDGHVDRSFALKTSTSRSIRHGPMTIKGRLDGLRMTIEIGSRPGLAPKRGNCRKRRR
jgi:hypothetical protein